MHTDQRKADGVLRSTRFKPCMFSTLWVPLFKDAMCKFQFLTRGNTNYTFSYQLRLQLTTGVNKSSCPIKDDTQMLTRWSKPKLYSQLWSVFSGRPLSLILRHKHTFFQESKSGYRLTAKLWSLTRRKFGLEHWIHFYSTFFHLLFL